MVFLTGKVLSLAALDKMEELYKLSESPNTEIVFRWIRVGIAARYMPKLIFLFLGNLKESHKMKKNRK